MTKYEHYVAYFIPSYDPAAYVGVPKLVEEMNTYLNKVQQDGWCVVSVAPLLEGLRRGENFGYSVTAGL